jgi:hypothetical protein
VAVLSSENENENGHAKQRWSTIKESPKDRNASSLYKLEGNWSAMGDDAQRKMKDYDGQLSTYIVLQVAGFPQLKALL